MGGPLNRQLHRGKITLKAIKAVFVFNSGIILLDLYLQKYLWAIAVTLATGFLYFSYCMLRESVKDLERWGVEDIKD